MQVLPTGSNSKRPSVDWTSGRAIPGSADLFFLILPAYPEGKWNNDFGAFPGFWNNIDISPILVNDPKTVGQTQAGSFPNLFVILTLMD